MFFECETYLSDDVRRLLTNENVQNDDEFFSECLNKDLSFNWSKIDSYLNASGEPDDLERQVDLLWPLMEYLHKKTRGIHIESPFFPELDSFYEWLNKGQDLLVVLKLTSQFERFLGDVFHLKNPKVPFLLKDLLLGQELQEIFGKVQIHILRILLGNVKGINIRNISWHGFISYGELKPSLISTLFLLINSTSTDLKKYLNGEKFTRRERITLNYYFSVPNFRFLPCPVPKAQLFYWNSIDLNLNCLIFILPLFEHILRLVFCQNHSLDCIKANTNDYYITMDDMLAPEYKNTKNCLIQILGSNLEMLLDLFNHPKGPRLRDRIGHDEIESVSPSLVQFSFYTISCCFDKMFKNKNTIYKSKFHVLPLLMDDLRSILENLDWDFPGVEVQKLEDVSRLVDIEIETLFRPKSEIHAVQQLNLISNKIIEMNKNVEENCRVRYKDWVEKKMRSRGRENYLKMIQVLPILRSTIFFLVSIMLKTIRSLNYFDLKYFKKCLKFVENLSVMCRMGENKWTQVEEMCGAFLAENEKFGLNKIF